MQHSDNDQKTAYEDDNRKDGHYPEDIKIPNDLTNNVVHDLQKSTGSDCFAKSDTTHSKENYRPEELLKVFPQTRARYE